MPITKRPADPQPPENFAVRRESPAHVFACGIDGVTQAQGLLPLDLRILIGNPFFVSAQRAEVRAHAGNDQAFAVLRQSRPVQMIPVKRVDSGPQVLRFLPTTIFSSSLSKCRTRYHQPLSADIEQILRYAYGSRYEFATLDQLKFQKLNNVKLMSLCAISNIINY